MLKGADWQKIPVSPTFSINNNAYSNGAELRCLYSPFLCAYLIEYYIVFITKPAADGKVYLNTGLELKNPSQSPAQDFAIISQVDAEAFPYPGVPTIAKYCQNGKLWFQLSFTNNTSMGNTVVRANGSILIPKDVDLW